MKNIFIHNFSSFVNKIKMYSYQNNGVIVRAYSKRPKNVSDSSELNNLKHLKINRWLRHFVPRNDYSKIFCSSLNIVLKYIVFFAFFNYLNVALSQIPGKKQDHPIALVGATLHTVTGNDIENGIIIFDKGKITALGKDISIPNGTEKINVNGKHVYPGLIDARTSLGLVEIGAVRATVDINETGRINPNIRAEVAINPESEIIPVTRANGITTALTIPGGGIITGTSALIMLDGWTWEDMTLKAPVGLHINWPTMTISRRSFMRISEEDQKKERDKQLKEISDVFNEARVYLTAKKAESNKKIPYHNVDVRMEAMVPVIEGKIPVFIHANELQQIENAVAWAEQEKLKIVIVGGRDSWLVTDLLKTKNIPVIFNPVIALPPRDWDGYDTPFAAPFKLFQAGVKFCIAGDGGYYNERNLPYHAAMASAFGLPKNEALKSITIYPAEILNVADKIGSLDIGKEATIIITNGDPLEITTNVERVFIQGRDIDLRNKHRTLYEKYLEKYRRMGLIKD
jgi:imidazolonepropionase-like amidohydrolase